jgi:hypothetical protein
MGLKDKKLISLKEIEGTISTHDGFVKREMQRRQDVLEYVEDVIGLAEYIGGEVVNLGLREDWAVKKAIFPGIEIVFVFNRADEEFASNLRVLYSGERVRKIHGEDLAELTIACVNHMLRYVRETNSDKELPEICYKV